MDPAAFAVLSKMSSPYPRSRFSLVISQELYDFAFYSYLWCILNQFFWIVYTLCLDSFINLFFACGCPVVPEPFIEKTLFAPFFFFLACEYSVASTLFVRKSYPFSFEFPLLLCQRSVDHIYMGQFLGSLLCSTDPSVYSFASTTQSWLL